MAARRCRLGGDLGVFSWSSSVRAPGGVQQFALEQARRPSAEVQGTDPRVTSRVPARLSSPVSSAQCPRRGVLPPALTIGAGTLDRLGRRRKDVSRPIASRSSREPETSGRRPGAAKGDGPWLEAEQLLSRSGRLSGEQRVAPRQRRRQRPLLRRLHRARPSGSSLTGRRRSPATSALADGCRSTMTGSGCPGAGATPTVCLPGTSTSSCASPPGGEVQSANLIRHLDGNPPQVILPSSADYEVSVPADAAQVEILGPGDSEDFIHRTALRISVI